MRARGPLLAAALMLLGAEAQAADAGFVVRGAGPETAAIGAEVAAALKKAGYRILDLKRSKKPGEMAKAEALGASLFVQAAVEKKKGRLVLRLEAFDLPTEVSRAHAEAGYKAVKEGPRSARSALATLMSGLGPSSLTRTLKNAALPGGRVVEPAPAPDPTEPPPAPVATPAAAAPPPPASSATAETTAPPPRSGSAPLLRLSLGGGSQLSADNTVQVAGADTGLKYHLKPIPLLVAGARFEVPGTALAFEAGAALVGTAKFEFLDGLSPDNPSGHFLDLGFSAAYALALGSPAARGHSSFELEPLLGIRYESFKIDPQSHGDVVLSQTALAPHLGLRARLSPIPELDLELTVLGRLVAGFSESPENTGMSGSGFGIAAELEARLWFTDSLAVSLAAGDHTLSVGLKGSATRPRMEMDPPLVDAKVAISNLRVQGGLVLAL